MLRSAKKMSHRVFYKVPLPRPGHYPDPMDLLAAHLSYGIYTKEDIAKDSSRIIDIQWEAEQLLGIGAAIRTVTQMCITISCKTITKADRLQRSLLSQAGWRVGC
jgi:hypothetical protein